MNDLVERLLGLSDLERIDKDDLFELCDNASEEIEHLRAENERLRGALELILSARAREFGIDYVEGCARAVLSQGGEGRG
jgi:hypothetical protein